MLVEIVAITLFPTMCTWLPDLLLGVATK
jgi:hypothetical protein